MKRTTLGRDGMSVSEWCLGTMTFGNQTPEDDAHQQMDMSLDAGIDFWDCAEMYPVNPVAKKTVGLSEEILGNWFAKTGRRNEVVLATKVAGPNPGWARDGAGYDGNNIEAAIDASLKRLQTDVIDLYQMHWPVRGSYAFRQNWAYDPSGQDKQKNLDHMHDVLSALERAVKAGKVKVVGMSNESAWGMSRWCDVADQHDLPRMVSVQNEYSLLYRLYDTDCAEMAVNEGISLLAYSPLGCGLLSGKYQNGGLPEGSRMAINGDLGGRKSDRVFDATQAYLDTAEKHGLDPLHMALAWQRTRPFHSIPIFGATTAEQLQRTLNGIDVVLSEDVLAEIEAAHKAHPMPF